MKLLTRFLQLPLKFDADLLAKEVAAVSESAWLPHPQKFAGNDFLPLISVDGEPANEAFRGQMKATPHLERCPYLVDVLAFVERCSDFDSASIWMPSIPPLTETSAAPAEPAATIANVMQSARNEPFMMHLRDRHTLPLV